MYETVDTLIRWKLEHIWRANKLLQFGLKTRDGSSSRRNSGLRREYSSHSAASSGVYVQTELVSHVIHLFNFILFEKRKNHFNQTINSFILLLLNPCHSWVLNIPRLISSSLYSNWEGETPNMDYKKVIDPPPPLPCTLTLTSLISRCQVFSR